MKNGQKKCPKSKSQKNFWKKMLLKYNILKQLKERKYILKQLKERKYTLKTT